MDMPLNCESSPLSNLLPWIRACHYEEYEVIKIVLLVLASVFLACAVVNFILLGYTVGWKNWNQNVRIKTQFIVCGLIVLGFVLQIVSFQDLWSIDPGYRRTLSVFAAGYSTYVAYTCVVVTLLYWYTVMLTLRASVERKPNREQKRVKVVVLAVAVVWGLAGLLLVVPSILFLKSEQMHGVVNAIREGRIINIVIISVALVLTLLLGSRVIMLFRRIQQERSKIAATTNQTPSSSDEKINRQASLIMWAVLALSVFLSIHLIAISILFAYGIYEDESLTWPETSARLLYDPVATMSLLMILLIVYRYNRDNATVTEMWTGFFQSVKQHANFGGDDAVDPIEPEEVVVDASAPRDADGLGDKKGSDMPQNQDITSAVNG